MKSSVTRSLSSRFVVFSLLISLLSLQTAMGLPSTAGVAAAEITVTGQRTDGETPFVMVNEERAYNGRTFFSNGTISTTETSSASVNLGKLGRVDLAPSSSLSLSFSEGRISGVLSSGKVNVSNVDGVSVRIETPHDAVTNEGNAPSRFAVSLAGGQTGVAVASGAVRHTNGAVTAKQDDDDDDDDDHWKVWAWAGGIAAAVVVIILVTRDDDDEIVSPVR